MWLEQAYLRSPFFRTYCPVFMFHRVLKEIDDTQLDSFIAISTYSFERIISFLTKTFTVVDIYEWVKNPSQKGCCAITFDDGWLDIYENAYPVLKKFLAPATIFLCTDMIGTNDTFWFERLRRLCVLIDMHTIIDFFIQIFSDLKKIDFNDKRSLYFALAQRLKTKPHKDLTEIMGVAESAFGLACDWERTVLDWSEIEEMSNYNISFGSHCVNHSILTNLPKHEKVCQIHNSKKKLEDRKSNIRFIPVISFPNGNFDEETVTISVECGYEIMLTASIRNNETASEGLLINRICISEESTLRSIFLNIVRGQLSGRIITRNIVKKC